VKQLFALNPHSIESSIAVAVAAIEAHDYVEARRILQPFMEQGLTRRVAALLARVEAEESGDKGRAREWLARAVTAPRDAAWIADGVTSDRWAPISPVTGALDAFEWRVPADEAEGGEERILGADLTEFIASGEPDAVIVKAEPVAIEREAAPPPKPAPAVSEAPVAAPPAKTPAPKAEAVDVTPEPAATKPVAQPPTDRSREHSQRTERTKIFTSPPVPDDPGPDPDDEIDPSSRAARA
jgi:HemY protein